MGFTLYYKVTDVKRRVFVSNLTPTTVRTVIRETMLVALRILF
jgi:hypothetical protein